MQSGIRKQDAGENHTCNLPDVYLLYGASQGADPEYGKNDREYFSADRQADRIDKKTQAGNEISGDIKDFAVRRIQERRPEGCRTATRGICVNCEDLKKISLVDLVFIETKF